MAGSPRAPWQLDPDVRFLNHGSFGACPVPVLDAQARWRDRLEAEPVAFFAALESRLDEARAAVGGFLGADPEGLAFVPNATTAIATVLASIRFRPDDELLTTDHEYNAILNSLRAAAGPDGATVRIVHLPFPVADPAIVSERILAAVTPRTRLALVSHVTSPTGVVLPIETIVPELQARGVDVIVDGAHAPGQVALDLDRLGAAYYAGNGHKWVCAPKGCGFLWVRADRRDRIRPLVTSHGANDPRTDRSRFRLMFDWVGTADPTAALSMPDAIRTMAGLEPDGWDGVRAANRSLALRIRDLLAGGLGSPPAQPASMVGSMVAAPLTRLAGADDAAATALHDALLREDRIEVPIGLWPVRAARVPGGPSPIPIVRVSAQRYVGLEDVEALIAALGRRGLAG